MWKKSQVSLQILKTMLTIMGMEPAIGKLAKRFSLVA
jgi:hypothetical protein